MGGTAGFGEGEGSRKKLYFISGQTKEIRLSIFCDFENSSLFPKKNIKPFIIRYNESEGRKLNVKNDICFSSQDNKRSSFNSRGRGIGTMSKRYDW